jgi:hypothetical protein
VDDARDVRWSDGGVLETIVEATAGFQTMWDGEWTMHGTGAGLD